MNIKNKIEKRFPGKIVRLLRDIGCISGELDSRSYVIGGFIRDLLLGIKNYDIDITVENSGILVAEKLAKKMNAKLIIHENFGTATVIIKNFFSTNKMPLKIDFATAREEHYKQPGALPDVKFSGIRDDLRRRDFTINAIAASIMKEDFGSLVDFFDGIKDLNKKTIRVLHDKSFQDDPTRIFRAIRFEQRFDFKIEPRTESLIRKSVSQKSFKTISKQRIGNEIILLLKEKKPGKSIERMASLNELRFIHPKLKFDKNISDIFGQIPIGVTKLKKMAGEKHDFIKEYLVYAMVLLKDLSADAIEKLCNDFSFPRDDKQKIIIYSKKRKKCLSVLKGRETLKSKIYKVLAGLSPDGMAAILAELKNKKNVFDAIQNYLKKTSKIKLYITGDTLKKIGFKEGPAIKEVLAKIIYAKIDGKIKTKKQELEMATKFCIQKGA